MSNFQIEVVDRLARIEEKLDNRPCVQHSKDIDDLKIFKIRIVAVASIISAIIGVLIKYL